VNIAGSPYKEPATERKKSHKNSRLGIIRYLTQYNTAAQTNGHLTESIDPNRRTRYCNCAENRTSCRSSGLTSAWLCLRLWPIHAGFMRTAVVPFVTAGDFSRVMMSYAVEKRNISAPNTVISTDYDISLSTSCLFDDLFPEAKQIFSILCIFMSL